MGHLNLLWNHVLYLLGLRICTILFIILHSLGGDQNEQENGKNNEFGCHDWDHLYRL